MRSACKQRVAELELTALQRRRGGGAASPLPPQAAEALGRELQAARDALAAMRPAVVAAAKRIRQLQGGTAPPSTAFL